MVIDLKTKKCVACEGTEAPMTKEEALEYLESVEAWELAETEQTIRKGFSFSNFSEALAFVNTVGDIAEGEGHHPDIYLHDYKHVDITLSTHAIGGLSENDFIMAAKIDGSFE